MGLSGMFQQDINRASIWDWPLTPSTAQGLGLLKCLIYDTDGLFTHMPIQVYPMTSSTIRIQRLYYPPISDTRPHAYQACEYWRTQDEVTKRALLTPLPFFFTIIYLFILADAWATLPCFVEASQPTSFGSSRQKGKPADLIPFASPSSLYLSFFSFSFFTLFSFPASDPPKISTSFCVFHFPDKLWVVGDGRGVLLDGYLFFFSSTVLQLFFVSMCSLALLLRCCSHLFNMPRSSEFSCLFVLFSFS